MPKLATVELHSCILLLSFHSACYLSNSGGFHAIKAKNGRSLGGGVAYIYVHMNYTRARVCVCICLFINIYTYMYIYIYLFFYLSA